MLQPPIVGAEDQSGRAFHFFKLISIIVMIIVSVIVTAIVIIKLIIILVAIGIT